MLTRTVNLRQPGTDQDNTHPLAHCPSPVYFNGFSTCVSEGPTPGIALTFSEMSQVVINTIPVQIVELIEGDASVAGKAKLYIQK